MVYQISNFKKSQNRPNVHTIVDIKSLIHKGHQQIEGWGELLVNKHLASREVHHKKSIFQSTVDAGLWPNQYSIL